MLKLVVLVALLVSGAMAMTDSAIAAALLTGMTFLRVPSVVLHSENIASAALAGLFLVITLTRPLAGRGRLPKRLVPFALAATCYLVLLATSSLWAEDPGAAMNAAVQFGLVAVLCCGVVATLNSPRALRFVIWTIISCGGVLATLSIVQIATHAYNQTFSGFAVVDFAQIIGQTNGYRVGGPFASPNFFGQLMVVPVALGLERFTGAGSSRMARRFGLVVAVLSAIAVFLTYSRGALIALTVVIGLWIWTAAPRRTRVVVLVSVACLTLVGLTLVSSSYRARIAQTASVIPGLSSGSSSISDPSLGGRQSAEIVGWEMFTNHPVLGVGAKNYEVHYLDYSAHVGLDPSATQLEPHSLFFEVATETGLVGLTVMIGIILVAFASLRRSRRMFDAVGARCEAGMIIGYRNGLVGYFIASLFLHAAYPQPLWVLLAIAWATPQCGMAGAPAPADSSTASERPGSRARVLPR